MNDGKQLEALVAFVEGTLLPAGYDVKTNQRIYNDEGVQIAEFDVEIRGKLGTTDIAWLIECRDRPGQGPAPGSWIEQLVGRRTRFGFNKVTAVSTTGFAEGAKDFAKSQGIELREVAALTPDAFSSWLELGHMSFVERHANLEHARVILNNESSKELQDSVHSILNGANAETRILRSTKIGESYTFKSAFLGIVESENLFEGLEPNGPRKSVNLSVQYIGADDRFVIDTPYGEARIEAIEFRGELFETEKLVPISVTSEYRKIESGEMISQVAGFEPQEIAGALVSLEFHHMGDTGETHVVLRKTPLEK